MNFAKSTVSHSARVLPRRSASVFFTIIISLSLVGCSDQVRMPTEAELVAFDEAGSITPIVDMDRIQKAKLKTGPYHIVSGDVLEFTMPGLLQAVTAAEVQAVRVRHEVNYPYLCRVRNGGSIALPGIERMQVDGLSLDQIEEKVNDLPAG
jgi:hypothetical protein